MTHLLLLLVILAVAASRSVPEPAPSTMGVGGIEQAVVESAVAQGRTSALRVDPRPSEVPPAAGEPLTGRASWVRAGLGPRYLAARMPKGTVLRICGALGCVVRVVMDYGPSRRLHPDRIVDLSRIDFASICGDPVLLGTCRVVIRILDVRPPETDAAGDVTPEAVQ